MNAKWSRTAAILALALVGVFAAVFLYRAIVSSGGKQPDIGAQLFIVAVGVGVAIATVLVADIDKTKRGWRRWLTPKNIAILFLAVVTGGGAVPLAASLFTPSPAVEDHPGQIRDATRETNEGVRILVDRYAEWPAFRSIAGYWGEERQNCQVVYRFERQNHALTVTLVRRKPGMGDYRMTASINEHGRGEKLNAVLRTSTEPDERGEDPLVFTFHSDGGGYQRLDWLNERRSDAGALRLEPCGAPE